MTEKPQYITYLSVDELFYPEECIKILNESDLEDPKECPYLVTDSENPAQVPNIRYLKKNEKNSWIGNRIGEIIFENNPATFNFNISEIDEMHILEWPEGFYYDMHYDLGPGKASTRKLSFMVYLNDKKESQGGEITFHLLTHSKTQQIPDSQGLLLFFSAYKPFKSTPVTAGKRQVLVGWVHGEHFV